MYKLYNIIDNVLLENLNNVTKAISVRNVIPILNGIKFELTDEGLFLTASNTDLTIKSFIKAKDIKDIKETGSIVIQSKYILEKIRKFLDNVIYFEVLDVLKVLIT